jgi:predicted transcriptional regulator
MEFNINGLTSLSISYKKEKPFNSKTINWERPNHPKETSVWCGYIQEDSSIKSVLWHINDIIYQFSIIPI